MRSPTSSMTSTQRPTRGSHRCGSRGSRRRVYNSSGRHVAELAESATFRLFINASDAVALGLKECGRVAITSEHADVTTVVRLDESLSAGVVSLPHCWRGLGPGEDTSTERAEGANAGRLINHLSVARVGATCPVHRNPGSGGARLIQPTQPTPCRSFATVTA